MDLQRSEKVLKTRAYKGNDGARVWFQSVKSAPPWRIIRLFIDDYWFRDTRHSPNSLQTGPETAGRRVPHAPLILHYGESFTAHSPRDRTREADRSSHGIWICNTLASHNILNITALQHNWWNMGVLIDIFYFSYINIFDDIILSFSIAEIYELPFI